MALNRQGEVQHGETQESEDREGEVLMTVGMVGL